MGQDVGKRHRDIAREYFSNASTEHKMSMIAEHYLSMQMLAEAARRYLRLIQERHVDRNVRLEEVTEYVDMLYSKFMEEQARVFGATFEDGID